jgi:hypothetical protein
MVFKTSRERVQWDTSRWGEKRGEDILERVREVGAVGEEGLGGEMMVDATLEALGGCVED